MKIQYLEIFFSKHFSDSIGDAYARSRYKQVFSIADTCSAGTLFYTTTAKDGLFLGTSGWDQYSLSEGFDSYIGQPLKDRFSNRFISWFKILMNRKTINFDEFLSKSSFFNFKRTFQMKLFYQIFYILITWKKRKKI